MCNNPECQGSHEPPQTPTTAASSSPPDTYKATLINSSKRIAELLRSKNDALHAEYHHLLHKSISMFGAEGQLLGPQEGSKLMSLTTQLLDFTRGYSIIPIAHHTKFVAVFKEACDEQFRHLNILRDNLERVLVVRSDGRSSFGRDYIRGPRGTAPEKSRAAKDLEFGKFDIRVASIEAEIALIRREVGIHGDQILMKILRGPRLAELAANNDKLVLDLVEVERKLCKINRCRCGVEERLQNEAEGELKGTVERVAHWLGRVHEGAPELKNAVDRVARRSEVDREFLESFLELEEVE